MQALTNENCPALDKTNPKAYTTFDARNGQIYYVAKIGNLCWMMSNLRYGGDGDYEELWGWDDDRYATTVVGAVETASVNDNSRPLTLTTGASDVTIAQYADPAGSLEYTNTTAIGGFYGYLYNWCAAMGGQDNACKSATSGFDTSVSICPIGWRLPVGNGGDFTLLNNTVNSGSTSSDSGILAYFLGVYSGRYDLGVITDKGSRGYMWSSNSYAGTSAYRFNYYASGSVSTAGTGDKKNSYPVRCVR